MIPTKSQLRDIALDVILNRQPPPNSFVNLELEVANVWRSGSERGFTGDEWLMFREVFWDLILDKVITVGLDGVNSDLPWFRPHSEALENLKRLEQGQKLTGS